MNNAIELKTNTESAATTHAYYIDEIKHETREAYYKHHEVILTDELKNLALEVYHLSYGHTAVSLMKAAETGVFYSNTVKFFIDTGDQIENIRIELPCPMPFSNTHQAIEIELFDESWGHYTDIMERLEIIKDGKSMDKLFAKIDELANSSDIINFNMHIKPLSDFTRKAVNNIIKTGSFRITEKA